MILGARQTLLNSTKNTLLPTNGTNIHVYVKSDNFNYVISSCSKASDSSSVIVDWGDGNVNTYTATSFQPSHVYINAGNYIISISDDISSLTWNGSSTGNNNREDIIAMYSFGTKLTNLPGTSFQGEGFNYHQLSDDQKNTFFEWYKNALDTHITNAYFTSMGSYACDCFMGKNLHFVNMTSITGSMFYANGLQTVQNLYFSKCNSINGDYLHDWSMFMNGNNDRFDFKSITFLNKTCTQIKAMSNFPWKATASNVTIPIWFIGTDGVMDKNGNIQSGMTSPAPQIIS